MVVVCLTSLDPVYGTDVELDQKPTDADWALSASGIVAKPPGLGKCRSREDKLAQALRSFQKLWFANVSQLDDLLQTGKEQE